MFEGFAAALDVPVVAASSPPEERTILLARRRVARNRERGILGILGRDPTVEREPHRVGFPLFTGALGDQNVRSKVKSTLITRRAPQTAAVRLPPQETRDRRELPRAELVSLGRRRRMDRERHRKLVLGFGVRLAGVTPPGWRQRRVNGVHVACSGWWHQRSGWPDLKRFACIVERNPSGDGRRPGR